MMRAETCRWRVATALLCAAAGFAPPNAAGQTLVGRVLDEVSNAPITGALVALVAADGDRRAGAIADSLGRFVLAPPEAGEYVVEAVRLGYETARSPLFSMTPEGSVTFELLMRASPVGLEGFEVSVEREAEFLLRSFGHTQQTLGRRWMGPELIERIAHPGNAGDVIRRQAIAGITVPPGSVCVIAQRARTGIGNDRCGLVVLNGAVVPLDLGGFPAIQEIEAIAVLTPVDATTFFGTMGGAGAVLIWTKAGGR